MNCKELKEGIVGNLKGIRRSGDLEVLYRHSELLKRLGTDKVDGKDFERAMILQKLFCNDLTERQLHMLQVITRTFCSKGADTERDRNETD